MAAEHFFLELEPPEERLRDAPHVVIVGGGFAGVRACKALAKADVRITLIDKRNFNLFQPLLYQVATGLVSRGDVATPLRQLVGKQNNVQVLLGEVTNLKPESKQIIFNSRAYSYDHLVLATGSGSTFFGHEQWRTFAPPMKILEHAEEIRRRLLMAIEQAEQSPDPAARKFLQTVVIVGGGPTGCEMAGAVSELMRNAMRREFKQLNTEDTRIVLVDPGDRLLKAMPESLSKAAQSSLEKLGVEVQFKARVQTMQPGEVTMSTPEGDLLIQAATVIWTAGVRPSHLGRKLAEAIDCELDRAGRVVVEPDFSIQSHPEIRVVGDLCSYLHTSSGNPLPGMAGPATQAGGFVGKDIGAIVAQRPRPNFNWFDFGSMAVLDRVDAVADLRGLKFSGGIGWILWALAHLAFMPERENRLTLLIKWIFAVTSQQRASMLLTGMPSQHIGLDAPDAPFPMQSGGTGPSISAPDAALKAAMEYYSNQVSGHQDHPADTSEGSTDDSAAAMR
ncbi:NAD(P)/FAD-dependent oxidoreductase [Synechococcus sp. MIT S9451]|uniref:NAD(P)/FAD-dependent oxidoreductase n=1 Tax=Synechococcus sp. MIT S9451 TaxID=3082543 RepID=UPI0039B62FB3